MAFDGFLFASKILFCRWFITRQILKGSPVTVWELLVSKTEKKAGSLTSSKCSFKTLKSHPPLNSQTVWVKLFVHDFSKPKRELGFEWFSGQENSGDKDSESKYLGKCVIFRHRIVEAGRDLPGDHPIQLPCSEQVAQGQLWLFWASPRTETPHHPGQPVPHHAHSEEFLQLPEGFPLCPDSLALTQSCVLSPRDVTSLTSAMTHKTTDPSSRGAECGTAPWSKEVPAQRDRKAALGG